MRYDANRFYRRKSIIRYSNDRIRWIVFQMQQTNRKAQISRSLKLRTRTFYDCPPKSAFPSKGNRKLCTAVVPLETFPCFCHHYLHSRRYRFVVMITVHLKTLSYYASLYQFPIFATMSLRRGFVTKKKTLRQIKFNTEKKRNLWHKKFC